MRSMLACVGLFLVLQAAATALGADFRKGQFQVNVTDKASGKPLAARMHLKDPKGKPVQPPKVPFWKDHFVFDGSMVLELAPGRYTFELECGPEYKDYTGYLILERGAADSRTIAMERYVDMKKEGWWSGDLHIHRPPEDIELLMRAEDLHIGPVITWWNKHSLWKDKPLPAEPLVQFDDNRFYRLLAGEDERRGGAVLFFNLDEPLDIAGATPEYPSALPFIDRAKRASGHVDAEKPFWWDVPLWIATGQIDSIGLANNHQQRDGMLDNEAWGKPRDKALFLSPQGNGRWSQRIYYQLLNCGLRIPPSAGSASGVLPNPVGYNRVYVHCGPDLTWDAWWEGLRRGRVTISNGPLIRPRVYGPGAPQDGALPGHVFQAEAGQIVELSVSLNLSTREKIEYLEIVQNGSVVHEVRLNQWAKANGKLPPVKFDRSGWMLIRAVTENPRTFRFASTGPYYVELGYEPRISKRSAQFFLDWVYERARQIQHDQPDEKQELLEQHRAARNYWQKLVERANAE